MPAPKDAYRDQDPVKQVLVVGGVSLSQLTVLAIVRGLALGAEPGSEQFVEHAGTESRVSELRMWLATSALWA